MKILYVYTNINGQHANSFADGISIKGTPLGDKAFEDGIVNIEAYKDFSNERRASVMDYSNEWLETLKYYKENWQREVYPFYNIKHYPSLLNDTKKIVRSVLIVGSFLTKIFYKKKIVSPVAGAEL